MTPQRKTLLSVAAMLVCANAVALAVMNHKPPRMWWFGMPTEQTGAPFDVPDPLGQMAVLDAGGLTRDGRRVPYAAMIDNMGLRRFRAFQAECFEADCDAGPWTIRAFASPETPLSRVFEAVQRAQALCGVQAFIFSDFSSADFGALRGFGYSMVFTHSSDPDVAAISSVYPMSTAEQVLRRGETLDQFGERTGCARVSPLRP